MPINLLEKTGLVEVLYDPCDQWIIDKYFWHLHGRKRNYLRGIVDGKNILLHRLILELSDPNIQGEHKDGNTFNFKRDNLRTATNRQNMQNRKIVEHINKTGFKGVSLSKSAATNPYRATICVDGKKIHLGCCRTAVCAAIMYNNSASENFKDYARLNVITEEMLATVMESDWHRINYKKSNSEVKNYGKTASKYRGVSPNKGKWSAEISKGGIRFRLGSFSNEILAAKAYNIKAIELYGDKAILNIIPEPQTQTA